MNDKPAFPTPRFYNETLIGTDEGLTKREYFAGLAMQGLIACETETWNQKNEDIVVSAVKIADALIAALGGKINAV